MTHDSILTFMAPLSGVIVPLDRVHDPVFAQRLAGDGVAIEPLSALVVAPCDARVVHVHRAHHAVTLLAQGLEIIVHVGLDTVSLKGEGFTLLVKTDDEVRAGDPLLSFDADFVARRARSLQTVILVSNMERVASIELCSGRVVAGRDVLMRVTLATAGERHGAHAPGETVHSSPIMITVADGLHARPAAALTMAARQFQSDLRLVRRTREANVRSVVSLMALEVEAGDSVVIVARGVDARDAVAGIERTLRTGLGGARSAKRAGTSPPSSRADGLAPPPLDGALRGVPASPGVALGQVFQLRHDDAVVEESSTDPQLEHRALNTAIAAARRQLGALQERLATEADPERAGIFAAHRELLEDPELLDRATAAIDEGASAAHAWRQAYTGQAERLHHLENPILAGRAADLRDVGRRVMRLLTGRDDAPPMLPADAIVIAEDLAPSDAASLDHTRVRGLCTVMGSATSHVAILARGLGIPAIAGIDPRALELVSGTRVVLDGDAGILKPSPSIAEETAIGERRATDERRRRGDLAKAAQPATTRDGHRVEVVANIGSLEEARRVPEVGAEGVGLLRTEFLFMDRHTAPDEDEQTRMYESILRALGPGRPLVIRTLDVGGDKPLSYLPMDAEANPFLGERGIRLTLRHPALFSAQVRAILRASTAGRVAIMFPMIATIAEWREARALVEREREALSVAAIEIGLMIETSAAALIAERFARDADFFSIGTNDLTQYTLAMDRTNPRLAPQVDALHPAVLRLIDMTAAGARAHGRRVAVCGALAGDLCAVPVLVGLGVHELSADVPMVPAVKARIRAVSWEECQITAREALDAGDGAEVRAIVDRRHGATT